MGYNTYYQLEVEGPLNQICPICGHEGEYNHERLIEQRFDILFSEENKWYDWAEDMKEYSKLFPNILFTLNGEGEESGDFWAAYIKNGKMQEERAEIQIAPFDKSKLK